MIAVPLYSNPINRNPTCCNPNNTLLLILILVTLTIICSPIFYPINSNPNPNNTSLGCMTGPLDKQWKPVSLPSTSDETTLDPYEYIYGKFSKNILEKTPIYKMQTNK